jgi:hypothetical protein
MVLKAIIYKRLNLSNVLWSNELPFFIIFN